MNKTGYKIAAVLTLAGLILWPVGGRDSGPRPARPGGSAAQGKIVFESLCAACHRPDRRGGDRAPGLQGLADRAGRRQILESILEPSKKITEGYQSVSVTLTNGRAVSGLLKKSGDPMEVFSGGKRLVIKAADIDTLALHKTSGMPSGLVDDLTVAELEDLLAYLLSLRGQGR